MKVLKYLFISILVTTALTSCNKENWERIEIIESKVTKLEALCNQMNSDVEALQVIVNALNENIFIKSIKEHSKDSHDGYVILFTNGKEDKRIAIYSGHDGKDGYNASTPVIGVKRYSDGYFYWTITIMGKESFIVSEDGKMIRAQAKNGKDGKDGEDGEDGANGSDGTNGEDGQNGIDGEDGITPQLKIEEGFWMISVDNGKSWEKLSEATGEDGVSYFKDVRLDKANGCVIFTLQNGEEIKVVLYDYMMDLYEDLEYYVNSWIDFISRVINDINSYDYITSVEYLVEEGDTVATTINFMKSEPITLKKGDKGDPTPEFTIGTAEIDGVYYWTLNIKDKEPIFITDATGKRIQAKGIDGKNGGVPYAKPELNPADNQVYWKIHYGDGTASWLLDDNNQKMKVRGTDADGWLSAIDSSNEDYVTFTLFSGEIVKIPTIEYHEKTQSLMDKANSDIQDLISIITALDETDKYFTDVKSVEIEGKVAYQEIFFNDGTSIKIFNGNSSEDIVMDNLTPIISIKQFTDGNYYWTIKFGSNREDWLLDENNRMIKAKGKDGADNTTSYPVIGIKNIDGVDYWTITIGTTITYPLDEEGNKIPVQLTVSDEEIYGSDNRIFKSVTANEDYLIIELLNGTEFKFYRYKDFKVTLLTYPLSPVAVNSEFNVTIKVEGTFDTPLIDYISNNIYATSITTEQNSDTKVWNSTMTFKLANATDSISNVKILVTDGKDKLIIKTIEVQVAE